MGLAALFLIFYAAALSLSPAVISRNSSGPFLTQHWLGVLIWAAVFTAAHFQSLKRLPGHDPYLLPAAALLSGWGLLTVWSLLPGFGLRQTVWLAFAGVLLLAGFRMPPDLRILRRYKHVWLSASLLLTAMTLVFGVNPLGFGARMWLGCCGFYFQPSEPLKLMLVAYLAAYMADRQTLMALASPANSTPATNASSGGGWVAPLLPLLAPTLVMAGLTIALLIIQRDLGTASIFLFLYASIVYVASQRGRVILFALLGLLLAALIGSLAYDLIRLRIDAWLNPWLDPSGRSYQIVQSLLAVANGGLIGRGPGLGSPEFVPLNHSDLIFAAISEQTGLIGIVGMLTLIGLIAGRGLWVALRCPDNYRRYLAAGLSTYLVGQSLLIIGGTLRLFPLTGITLPFVSYGGSSLLVAFAAVLLLMIVSTPYEGLPVRKFSPRPFLRLSWIFGAGIALSALAAGWWAVYRGPDLLTRTDNPRRSVSDQYVRRGALLDRNERLISVSSGSPGEYVRRLAYPALSNIVGYTHPTYGQSGLEASLDEILRGLEGYPFPDIWWNQLIYGQPPPGLDVRLSLDLDLQANVDALLDGHHGALVLINAQTGEILAMASHPTFDANRLDQTWADLVVDPAAPLLNRATLGRYPAGDLDQRIPQGISGLGVVPMPGFDLPVGDHLEDSSGEAAYSPLQAALAAAALTAEGIRPAPQLAIAMHQPHSGWMLLPSLEQPQEVISDEAARGFMDNYADLGRGIWQVVSRVHSDSDNPITWYLGGSLPGSERVPLALALVLEEDAPDLAEQIGQSVLRPLP